MVGRYLGSGGRVDRLGEIGCGRVSQTLNEASLNVILQLGLPIEEMDGSIAQKADRPTGNMGIKHWRMFQIHQWLAVILMGACGLAGAAADPQNVYANQADNRSVKDGDALLMEAAQKGQIKVMDALMASGANRQLLTRDRQTLLHVAASSGQAEVVAHLLDLGLSADLLDNANETALMKAARQGHVAVVRQLARRSPLSQWNAKNETALTLTSENGHLDVVKALLDAGSPATGKEGDRAIANAVETKQVAVTRYLLQRGANVNARGFLGRPLISLAAWTHQPDLAIWLLANGADPKLNSESGASPLAMAIEWTDSLDLVNQLLRRGAVPEPAFIVDACGKKSPAMLLALLRAGSDLAATNDTNETCLHAAVRSASLATFAFVLQQPQAKAQMAAADSYGYTPLMRAASKSGPEFTALVDKLLAAGSPLGGQDRDGNTVLHVAAEANNAASIRLLLTKGAPQTKNQLDMTPIAWAANWGKLDAVLALDQAPQVETERPWLPKLIESLVDRAQDSAGLARALKIYAQRIGPATRSEALYWAVNEEQFDAARVLLGQGADPNTAKSGVPIVRSKSVAMAELLFKSGAKIDQSDPKHQGRTALLEVAKQGNIALTQWLLAHGAKPNLQDAHGWNALDYARATGLHPAIAAIEQAGGKSTRPSTVLWATDVLEGEDIDGFTAQPLVVGEQLIAGHENGFLYALDRKTGRINWKRNLGGKISHAVRLLDGDLFVTSNSHALYRIRAQDGAVVWRTGYSGGQIASGAWAWKDVALFADFGGIVHAVDLKTGQVRWEKKLGGEIASAVAGEDAIRMDGDRLYFLNESGLNRLDLTTGAKASFAAKQVGMPEVADGLAFLPSKDKHLYVLDAKTLKLMQDVTLQDESLLRPLYFDGRLYLPLRTQLLALPMRNPWLRALGFDPLGKPDWQIEIAHDMYARPVAANGLIYSFRPVKPADSSLPDAPMAGFFHPTQLFSLDPASGLEKSSLTHALFDSKMVTPAVSNDAVYVLPLGTGHRVLAVKALP